MEVGKTTEVWTVPSLPCESMTNDIVIVCPGVALVLTARMMRPTVFRAEYSACFDRVDDRRDARCRRAAGSRRGERMSSAHWLMTVTSPASIPPLPHGSLTSARWNWFGVVTGGAMLPRDIWLMIVTSFA